MELCQMTEARRKCTSVQPFPWTPYRNRNYILFRKRHPDESRLDGHKCRNPLWRQTARPLLSRRRGVGGESTNAHQYFCYTITTKLQTSTTVTLALGVAIIRMAFFRVSTPTHIPKTNCHFSHWFDLLSKRNTLASTGSQSKHIQAKILASCFLANTLHHLGDVAQCSFCTCPHPQISRRLMLNSAIEFSKWDVEAIFDNPRL